MTTCNATVQLCCNTRPAMLLDDYFVFTLLNYVDSNEVQSKYKIC